MLSRALFTLALALALDAQPAEVTTSLYVAPQLQFKLIKGTVLPHDVVMCSPTREETKFGDHADKLMTFYCDEGVILQMDNVIFPPGKVAVKIESIHAR